MEGIDIAFQIAECDISDKLVRKGKELFERARAEARFYEVALKCFVFSKVTFLFWKDILSQLAERGEKQWYNNYSAIIRKQINVDVRYKTFFDKVDNHITTQVKQFSLDMLSTDLLEQQVSFDKRATLFEDSEKSPKQSVVIPNKTERNIDDAVREQPVSSHILKIDDSLGEYSTVSSHARNIDDAVGEPPVSSYTRNIDDAVGEPPPVSSYTRNIDDAVGEPPPRVSSYTRKIDDLVVEPPPVSSHIRKIGDSAGEYSPFHLTHETLMMQ
jgi:hypothetical protein